MPGFNRIRPAKIEDADSLGMCMQAAYSPYLLRLGVQSLPPMEADYRDEIDSYPCWVVEADGRIVGGLIMTLDTERAGIANIAVDPQYQGRGIGGELMRFAESRARQAGYREIHLATHALLSENISLYRHFGFHQCGRSGERVFMSRTLD